jgi:pyruvate dehydrogenase E2 component (dihydrolipoamide acetyltransferase)
VADAHVVIPLSAMRKVVATRMLESKQTIPHFRVVTDVDVGELLALRAGLRERAADPLPSFNDLLIKGCAKALMVVPAVNVQFVDGQIHQYSNAHISVVTAVTGGLSTPIVRNAEAKTIWEIARETKDLATRAAKNVLKMHEVFGGSFSLSNLGMHGVDQFDAIINPPQCAILAVGSAKQRVVAGPEQQIRLATLARLTLSVDHRVIDGVTAAEFLSALRAHLEQPAQLLN